MCVVYTYRSVCCRYVYMYMREDQRRSLSVPAPLSDQISHLLSTVPLPSPLGLQSWSPSNPPFLPPVLLSELLQTIPGARTQAWEATPGFSSLMADQDLCSKHSYPLCHLPSPRALFSYKKKKKIKLNGLVGHWESRQEEHLQIWGGQPDLHSRSQNYRPCLKIQQKLSE